jgi:hypothetical protein
LRGVRYRQLSKGQRGVVRRLLVKITGLSRAQVTKLLTQFAGTGNMGRFQLRFH